MRLTITDHITHLWHIVIDPIAYLCHSTTMETPHMGLVCAWIFTHDVKWHLRESMSLYVGAGVSVRVCGCVCSDWNGRSHTVDCLLLS